MENYTLKTVFPNAQCDELLGSALVTKLNADVNSRTITAEVTSKGIIEYCVVESFKENVKRHTV